MERPVRVLIADDRWVTRQGIRALLSQFPQVEVVGEATDGQESIDMVPLCHPDVVLLDVQMPIMDGLEATKRIKSRWPSVRVVVLTMYARYRSPALAAGADVFLLKGGTTENLQEAIMGDTRHAEA
jgi:DNA-binding NarL/FixJ family response regulator